MANAPLTIPTILAHDSGRAQHILEAHYADALAFLLMQGHRYRVDVEEPTEGNRYAGQQHQLVIYEGSGRPGTLRLWLRPDGQLVDLETGPVTAPALRTRVERWLHAQRQHALTAQLHQAQVARQARTFARWACLIPAVAVFLTLLALGLAGPTTWVLSAVWVSAGLGGLSLVGAGGLWYWLRWEQQRIALA